MTLCPQCHQTARLLFRTRDRNRKISCETFDYFRCDSCGLIFLSPRPPNLGDYYAGEYYQIPSTLEELGPEVEAQHYKLDIVQQFVPAGNLLEIGPAYGNFAYPAKQAGYQVSVIEMDADCCKFLENVVGVQTIHSDNPAAALRELEKYDVIALWHVIEHLGDPWGTLEAIAGHLNPGGIVVIAAPNPAALQFRIFGRFWTHVDAPRHLSLIPVPLLQQRMETLGLDTRLITTSDPGGIGWNLFGWQVSLMNLSEYPPARRSLCFAGRVINKLLSRIERQGLRGSAYTLVFGKQAE